MSPHHLSQPIHISSGYNMQKLINGTWIDCTQDDLSVGDEYRISVGDGGWQQQKYALVVPESIRLITTGAFRQRLPKSARKQMREVSIDDATPEFPESVIDDLLDLREDLDGAMYIDLDDETVISGVAGLEAVGWITAPQGVDQLADGTTKEKYNGVH